MANLRFDNQAEAIAAAVLNTERTGKQWGVWSYDMDWDGPRPDQPCWISDTPQATYSMLVFVTLTWKVISRETEQDLALNRMMN